MPDICGSTTLTAAATAMAASTAFPPCWRMKMPAWEASGWPEATIPFLPMISGLFASKCTPWGELGMAASCRGKG